MAAMKYKHVVEKDQGEKTVRWSLYSSAIGVSLHATCDGHSQHVAMIDERGLMFVRLSAAANWLPQESENFLKHCVEDLKD